MILLRDLQEQDLDALERLAQTPGFINLQGDRDALREKIARSAASFATAKPTVRDEKYIFAAYDTAAKRVLGTSMIAAQHGTEESPHFYFEVDSEEKFSETINTGFIHGTLKLKYDTNGPSEIGGLVIDPEQRNHEARVGRQISFVRFLYLGLHRDRFKRRLLAELLPPLNKKGQSPLWEAIGRRFTNMDYWEADQLCQKNKEFIFSLFPTGKIYTTFLPAEARNAIGRVGKDTEPVVHMLKKIGFKYENQVDPFDGGPHLWADVDSLVPLKRLATYTLAERVDAPAGAPHVGGLVCATKQAVPGFRAAAIQAQTQGGLLAVVGGTDLADLRAHLGVAPGQEVHFMPYY